MKTITKIDKFEIEAYPTGCERFIEPYYNSRIGPYYGKARNTVSFTDINGEDFTLPVNDDFIKAIDFNTKIKMEIKILVN